MSAVKGIIKTTMTELLKSNQVATIELSLTVAGEDVINKDVTGKITINFVISYKNNFHLDQAQCFEATFRKRKRNYADNSKRWLFNYFYFSIIQIKITSIAINVPKISGEKNKIYVKDSFRLDHNLVTNFKLALHFT